MQVIWLWYIEPYGIPAIWFGLCKEIIGDLCRGTIEFLHTTCQLSKGVMWALPSHALSFIKVWLNPSRHSPLPSGLWPLCKTSWSISLLALSASHCLCWFSSSWLICCIVRKLLCWNNLLWDVWAASIPLGFPPLATLARVLYCIGRRLNLMLPFVLHLDRLPNALASSFSSVVNEGFTLPPDGGCLVVLQWPHFC